MKHKYEIRNMVIVYKCAEYPIGFVGVIMDRDKLEKVYLVKDVMKPEIDRWVKEENLFQVYLDRPKNFWERLRRAFR